MNSQNMLIFLILRMCGDIFELEQVPFCYSGQGHDNDNNCFACFVSTIIWGYK